MLFTYVKTAYRTLTRQKYFSLINILGLAIGMTTAIFILLYVTDELTYDKAHKNHERIYRLESHFITNNKDDFYATTPMPMGPTLKDEYPEIEKYVRFSGKGAQSDYFQYEDKEFQEDNVIAADSTIFRVFTHPFIAGDPEKALNRPNTMVMTESMAHRYFGAEDPIGKTITLLQGGQYEVTGIIEDLPDNVHLKFDGLTSYAGANWVNDRSATSFWSTGGYSYIMLKENASIDHILDDFPRFYDKYMKQMGDQINSSFVLMATPLTRVHHYSKSLMFEQEPTGNIKYAYIFTVIGILILIIASINYMNLATARSARRSKETGILKIGGATRKMLINRFFTESIGIALIALIVSVGLIRLLLPYFNMIAGKSLDFSILSSPLLIAVIIGVAILVGLLSGAYPAFYLSSFNPAQVLKGQADLEGGNGLLRKILVVFQFAISVAMIIGTFIIGAQFRYMQNTDPGFDKEDVMIIELRDPALKKSREFFRQELMRNPEIKDVAYSFTDIGGLIYNVGMRVEGDSGTMQDRTVNFYSIDYDYIDLMGLKILSGRSYDKNIPSDFEKAFIINETAAREFGWVDSASMAAGNYESALGKHFQFGMRPDGSARRDGRIIGVVNDFHYASMHNKIEPLVLPLIDQDMPSFYANIKIGKSNRQGTINFVDQVRQKFNDPYPFKYEFMYDRIAAYYRSESRIGMLARAFTLLTVIIAALGLLGLSSYLTQARTKEIGIRKVNGARISEVMAMLNKDFVKWVVIAIVIATPIAYFAMNKWLQSFAYRTGLSWWVFVLAGLLALAIALLTVSWQSYRAASRNPVEALRYE